MAVQTHIVIGGSAGSMELLKNHRQPSARRFSSLGFHRLTMVTDFPSMLAKVLSRSSSLPTIAPDQEQIRPGHIYVSRPDYGLESFTQCFQFAS